ncbi:hypothetical protein WDW37_15595 [Bdellovibrionota bacterium FG-1]
MENQSSSRSIFLYGEISWHHISRSRGIRKMIEKGISRWGAIQDNGTSSLWYRAMLDREGDGHWVHCQIAVEDGARTWFGSTAGLSIQQAVAECLTHMRSMGASSQTASPQGG